MDRVSGWYKRYVAKITLVIGAVLVLLLNINVLTIGRTLYTQSTVSRAISTVAAKSANCPVEPVPAGLPGQAAGAVVGGHHGGPADRVGYRPGLHGGGNAVQLAGPARASSAVTATPAGSWCWSWPGFLIMIIALVPGARFWFGLLSKLGALRAAGPKPAADAS